MIKMEKNKEDIIDSVLDKSDSQQDRKDLEVTKSLNLINFLNNQIEKSNAKDGLRDDVISELKNAVRDKNEKLPAIVLIRLLEVLEKSNNDVTLGVLSTMKDTALIKALTGEKGKNGSNDKSFEMNKDDVDNVKKLLNYLNKVDVSEGN
jgi:hypothetical protein